MQIFRAFCLFGVHHLGERPAIRGKVLTIITIREVGFRKQQLKYIYSILYNRYRYSDIVETSKIYFPLNTVSFSRPRKVSIFLFH